MTRQKFFSIQIFWLLLAALSVVFFHSKLENAVSKMSRIHGDELIPSAQAVGFVTLGFDQVVADYYWLQFIGYVGDSKNREIDHYVKADKYIDLITGLDPQFVQAYWFATFTVGGDQRQPQRAAELIDRGIKANPDNWYLPCIAGFNQIIYAKDDVAAAKYYRMAAKFPNAPEWLERQAEIIETHSPRLIKEGYSWLSIYQSAREERVRVHAKEESVRVWVRAFKSAPNKIYKDEARRVLNGLGIDIDAIAAAMDSKH